MNFEHYGESASHAASSYSKIVNYEIEIEKQPVLIEDKNFLNKKKHKFLFFGFCCFLLFVLVFVVSWFATDGFTSTQLKVVYWNLKDFGISKLDNEDLLSNLRDITSSYDIIILIELEQSECDTNLYCSMRLKLEDLFPEHSLYLSPSLGANPNNNRGKEQIGFMIRKKYTYFVYSYFDTNGIFARKPYYIYVSEYNINIATVHISAQNSESEVSELPLFFSSIEGDFVLLGDLNICDPSTLNNQQIKKEYQWLLNDDDKTNSNLNCAYDRIISPLNFNRFSHARVVSSDNEAQRVSSDHYPLSVKISL